MRKGCGGRTLLCADKDRLAVCSVDQRVGYMLQFLVSHTDTREVSSVLSVSARKQGKKSALYKVWTFVPTVSFQQRPAGKFCRIISSVASSDCSELVAISPVHLQLAAQYLPLDSVLRATKVVICIWDCLIRSLY